LATEIQKLISDPKTCQSDIAAVIKQDMTIASRILRIANSTYYGIPRKIDNLKTALVVLGMNEISRLITTILTINLFKEDENFDMKAFWLHGTACADLNVGLYTVLRLKCPTSAHVAGLLHDIGKVILFKYLPEYFDQCVNYMNEKGGRMVDAEIAVLGIDHGHIGSWLIKKWNIPVEISDTLARHHIRHFDSPIYCLPYVTDWSDRLFYIFKDHSEEEAIEFLSNDKKWLEWVDGRILNNEAAVKKLYGIYERSSLLLSLLS
jgi:HD-like signal output (HDOD) protein